jgi:hypothetical protein
MSIKRSGILQRIHKGSWYRGESFNLEKLFKRNLIFLKFPLRLLIPTKHMYMIESKIYCMTLLWPSVIKVDGLKKKLILLFPIYLARVGIFYTNYSYITVFLRNAAYLTHLKLKASRFRNGNKSFKYSILICLLRRGAWFQISNQLIFLRGDDFSNVSSHLQQ